MAQIDNTMTNKLVSENSQNNLLRTDKKVPFPLTPIIYLSLMDYMKKTRLLLVVEFIFPLNSLILSSKELILISIYPVF